MKQTKSLRHGRFAAFAKWCFSCAVLAALIPATTSSVPNRSARAEAIAPPAATPGVGSVVTTKVVKHDTPESRMAYASLLGVSGGLRAVIGTTDVLLQNPVLKPVLTSGEKTSPWPKLATPDGESLTVVQLVPFGSAKEAGFGSYSVGKWPSSNALYTPPPGFIGVTQENQGTSLSTQFKVSDFLTHDQGDVWPKVLVVRSTILDKLELIHQDLERKGLPSRLHVMSGFRTPQYNAKGVGKGGRATHSRHMYGDAADVFVDSDGDGMMDDLNGDGKVTVADAKVLRAAAERVEAQYPELVGGLSAYPANSAHGPFVHVDTRGFKARW